jgi:hypothetical protein
MVEADKKGLNGIVNLVADPAFISDPSRLISAMRVTKFPAAPIVLNVEGNS